MFRDLLRNAGSIGKADLGKCHVRRQPEQVVRSGLVQAGQERHRLLDLKPITLLLIDGQFCLMGVLEKRTMALLLVAILLLPTLVVKFAPEWAAYIYSFVINDPKWILGIVLGIVFSLVGGYVIAKHFHELGKKDNKTEDFTLIRKDISPPPKNLNFTGRTAILEKIYRILNSQSNAYVISGAGGMGKTQIAAEYLHKHKNEYRYTWWLPAFDPTALSSYYASLAFDLAREPGFPKAFCKDLPSTIATIKNWLDQDHGWKWLMVLDNAAGPDAIKTYLPSTHAGHVIITTRNSRSVWDHIAYHYKLSKFEPSEAIDFLIRRTGEVDRAGSEAIAIELGYLPLALEQAGAYIKETGGTLETYLEQLNIDRISVLSKSWPPNYPEPVSRTWNISFEKAKKEMPLSANLLYLCSFFAPEPERIPKALLSRGLEYLNKPTPRSSQLDEAIQILVRYSLVTVVPNNLYVHNLVQDVIRYQLPEEDKKHWAEVAVEIIDSNFSFDQRNMVTWAASLDILSHAIEAARYGEMLDVARSETARISNEIGLYLMTLGEYTDAINNFQRALKIDKEIGFKEGESNALGNIGLIYKSKLDSVMVMRQLRPQQAQLGACFFQLYPVRCCLLL